MSATIIITLTLCVSSAHERRVIAVIAVSVSRDLSTVSVSAVSVSEAFREPPFMILTST